MCWYLRKPSSDHYKTCNVGLLYSVCLPNPFFFFFFVCVCAEKEVTGSMLCEFCEEDIKDVFKEFKDRFRIRKLLRDIADKPPPPRQQSGQSCQLYSQQAKEKTEPSSHDYGSPGLQVSPKLEAASSALLRLSSPDHSLSALSGASGTGSMPLKHLSAGQFPEVIDIEEIEVKDEREHSLPAKKQRVDDVPSTTQIPVAHSYSLLQSTSGQSSRHHSFVDGFVPPPPPIPAFFNKPDFHPAFSAAHSLMTSGYSHSHEEQRKTFSGSVSEDQALCLKKSPQRIPASQQLRNDTASPATQPSSTTPDYLSGLDSMHLDLASVMTMGQLAAKYRAHEILSKKGQRSRPNSAQKLGSILIRNAAQQANLWSDPPHLRSISQPQRQEFLNSVYRIAPHIREYEHLLWQRLSETLQNRRKYLLDKKLGKRGFSSSNQSTSSSSSSSSHHDFPDVSEWQVTSMHSHLSSMGDESHDDVNILNEVVAAHDYSDSRPIKKEPVSWAAPRAWMVWMKQAFSVKYPLYMGMWGAGIALWYLVEHWTRDNNSSVWVLAGAAGECSYLWSTFCVDSHFGICSTPMLSQQHIKDPVIDSFCQKCWWQVTAKHIYMHTMQVASNEVTL